MTLYLKIALIAVVFFAGCKNQPGSVQHVPDGHTSMNAVDWTGTYTGVLPCADCEAIKVVMTLYADLTYNYQLMYVGKSSDLHEYSGNFIWNDDGNSITLKTDQKDVFATEYKVGENRIFQLDLDGNPISGDLSEMYVLEKPDFRLFETRWKLLELNGKSVPGEKALNSEPYMKLSLLSNQVVGNASCNNFFGSFEMLEGNGIRFSALGATKMACPDMEVENALFKTLESSDVYFLSGDTLFLGQDQKTTLARFIISTQ